MRFLVPGLLLALTLAACGGRNTIFEQTEKINGSIWHYADSLQYEVAISDTNRLYNLLLDIGYVSNFPSQNLYVRIHTIFPDGKREKAVVNFDLTDPAGQQNGECNGDNCILEASIQQGAWFNTPGKYRFVIEQFMRTDSLSGIKSVSMLIEDTGKNKK